MTPEPPPSISRRRVLGALAAAPWVAGVPMPSVARGPVAPPRTSQLLLGIADDWSSSRGRLHAFHRDRSGKWVAAFEASMPILLGRNGLVWGRGVLPTPDSPKKREGDRKAPAGYFAMGTVFGYDTTLPRGSDPAYPYRQVTKWDAWPDDPKNPYYNKHVVIDPKKGVPSWFEGQKMRLGDAAYHWLIEVRHNAEPKPVPGGGSAIFFHIRRGPDRSSFGCTTMRREDLENVLRWLRRDARPHYVLLPRAEYRRLRKAWDLPEVKG